MAETRWPMGPSDAPDGTSDLLFRFVQPLIQDCDDFRHIRTAYVLGAMAWNVAVMHDGDPGAMVTTFEKRILPELKGPPEDLSRALWAMLLARKVMDFSTNHCIITDVRVEPDEEDGYRVAVVYGMVGEGRSHNWLDRVRATVQGALQG